LLCLDGTGYFSSSTIHCAQCLEKHHGDGTIVNDNQTQSHIRRAKRATLRLVDSKLWLWTADVVVAVPFPLN